MTEEYNFSEYTDGMLKIRLERTEKQVKDYKELLKLSQDDLDATENEILKRQYIKDEKK